MDVVDMLSKAEADAHANAKDEVMTCERVCVCACVLHGDE
jgi:hypothetical protein